MIRIFKTLKSALQKNFSFFTLYALCHNVDGYGIG